VSAYKNNPLEQNM